ncbi:CopD family protein [Stenotrophomonas lactitubi]|uniref:CopD family protein n=1 Tax=Stenotrophomonas lactitubi TaxID=2045214 RepID=UPI003341C7AD
MTALWAYSWWKALHVASALVFVSGVFSVAGFLQLCNYSSADFSEMAATVRRWDRLLTTPAMLMVWAFGLQLAASGGWYGSGWLQLKLILVVMLSGLHGMQSARLRRLSIGTSVAPSGRPWVLLGILLGISILVVVKPF